MKKTIITLTLILLFLSNVFSQTNEQPQTNTPNTNTTEIDELKKREEELRKREEELRKRELELKQRERGVVDRTGYEEEMQRREQARIEREKMRATTQNQEITSKYSVNIYGGVNILLNPPKIDFTEKKSTGANFGAKFLYAVDNNLNVKVGIDISYSTHLQTFTFNNGSEFYSVKTSALFVFFTGRYEFFRRKNGDKFIPYAGILLGIMFPGMENARLSRTYIINFGIEGGFDFWLSSLVAINFNLRFFAGKYNVLPDASYSEDKYLFYIAPQLGVTFAF